MLKDERFLKIIEIIDEAGTIKTSEIAEKLDISLATVRRDLNELDRLNKLKKIFGGAKTITSASYITTEEDMQAKSSMNVDDKNKIGKFAASLIKDNDFIYLDAGSSVTAMINHIKAKDLLFMTNSFGIAKKVSALNYKVFVIPGELKVLTDSLIGASSVDYLNMFNFSLGFFGTNGIHKEIGFTTPDINESIVKAKAVERCNKAYVLADYSKFGKVSKVTFCSDINVEIITKKDEDVIITNYKEIL